MTTRRKFTLSALGLLAVPSYSLGGWKSLVGNEDYAWKEGGYNLIVAEVKEISAVAGDKAMGTHTATLIPIATLAGTLDPSAVTSLGMRLYCGVAATSIIKLPQNGAVVLAVLGEKGYVTSDACQFMPDHSALVPIDGPGDKRVMETVRKLRLIRHPVEADSPPDVEG